MRTSATQVRREAVHAAFAARSLQEAAAHVAVKAASLGTVIDVAWFNPTVAQVQSVGAVGVIGYLSTDSTKNLSGNQVQEYTAAGIAVGTVWETTAGRALAGHAAGVADAKAAEAQRKDIGLPATHLHRAAVDTDTTWAAVSAYFAGWASVVGIGRIAPYGGVKIAAGAYAAGYRRCWQTLAWSNGQVDPHAVLYQSGGTLLSGQADINHILAPDWGQYPPLETDMALTSADILALLNHRMPAYANVPDSNGKPYTPTIGECISGARQADTKADALAAELTALSAKVSGIAGVTLTDAQVAAVAAAVVPLLAPILAKDLGDLLAQRLAN
jgi:hypothetical protein